MKHLSRLLTAGLCLAGSASALGADPTERLPEVLLTVPLGGSESRSANTLALQVQIGYANSRLPGFAEVSLRESGLVDLKVGGVQLLSTFNPYLHEGEGSGAEPAESSGGWLNWKTVGLGALGVAAMAALAGSSGGGGGDPSNPGSTTDSMNVCALNGNPGSSGVGDQVPDACVPVGGG